MTAGEPTLTVRSPQDVLAMIPYLLGFHPEDSVVLLVLASGRVRVTARFDADAVSGRAHLPHLDAVLTDGADAVIVVAYTTQRRRARTLARRMQADAVRGGRLARGSLGCLMVVSGRWWCVGCADCAWSGGQDCGTEVSAIAAEAVYRGLGALGSRSELERVAAGPGPERHADCAYRSAAERHRVGALSLSARVAAFEALIRRAAQERIDEGQLVTLAALLADPDLVGLAIAGTDPAQAGRQVDLWSRVLGQVVAPLDEHPLVLLAFMAWLSGNGALQVICMELLAQRYPDNPWLVELERINLLALPPRRWAGPMVTQ